MPSVETSQPPAPQTGAPSPGAELPRQRPASPGEPEPPVAEQGAPTGPVAEPDLWPVSPLPLSLGDEPAAQRGPSLRPLLLQSAAAAREALQLTGDLARIAWGTDELLPAERDRRFADPAWRSNPAYRRLGQTYTAVDASLVRLVDDWEDSGASWRSVEQVRLLVSAARAVGAPTNTLAGNPAALRRAVSTRGRSLLRGARNLAGDVLTNRGMPTTADRTAFRVGHEVAVTPGAVVQRDEVAELLQYAPSTDTVRRRPVLVVPPPIGRYYFLDLRPGRSFVEHAASRGLQVFLLSWRNPGPEQRDWDLDTYAARIVAALEAVSEVTGSEQVDTIGFCAGGQLQSLVLNALEARGEDRVATASYAVTLLDLETPGALGAVTTPALLGLAGAVSRARGTLDAKSLGAVFSWMRPQELVTDYWVSNYLMGEAPPAFDILAWNADGTDLPAALHQDFLSIARDNSLVDAGRLTVLGEPVDLSRIRVPNFVTGGVTDHLTPWQGCYRTTQLLSGPSTFVLSNAGHIASLVNPPSSKKASCATGPVPGPDPLAWREAAVDRPGSWWDVWADWQYEQSDERVPAPAALGSTQHQVLGAAPGTYVRLAAGAAG